MSAGHTAMNLDAVRSIANAVLYEGYILYPYRASSAKNQSRWQFGVVMAPGYAAADPSESSFTQAEVVLAHTGQPVVQVILRFLQVQRRTTEGSGQGWDEAVEREIEVTADAAALLGDGVVEEFAIAGGEDREPLDEPGGPDGTGPRYAVRRREPLAGAVSVRAIGVPGPWRAVRLQVRVENRTAVSPVPRRREDALPSALIAAHTIIGVSGGEFISMTDPPIWAQPAVAECQNEGGWPVLADPGGGRQVVLSSPIILYDHPELAAESPGELYDGTEIDEILTLRTLALSDAEKAEARATDPRAAALLDRVESMDAETMARLHGTIRSLRPAARRPARHRVGRPLVGPGRGCRRVPGHRHRDHRRPADRPRQPGAAAAGSAPRRRAGHVPDRADRGRPGRAARRGRQAVPGRVAGRPAGRGPADRARALPVLQHRRGGALRGAGRGYRMTGRTLVAGVGNVFLRDDAFGCEVVRLLATHPVPDGVEVRDFGIRGVHLAYDLLDGCDLFVLVDAAPRGEPPGTVTVLEVQVPDPASLTGPVMDAHDLTPDAIFALLASLGGRPGRSLVVACEPADVSAGMGLSEPVSQALPHAVRTVEEILAARDSDV